MKKAFVLFLTVLTAAGALSCASSNKTAKPDVVPSGSATSAETEAEAPLSGVPVTLMEAINGSAARLAEGLPKGSRVAIIAFESESAGLSDFVMEELTGALVDRGIEVADRQNLWYLEKEFKFQMSGSVSDEDVKSVGKFMAADMVITGQMQNLGDTYRYRAGAIHMEQATRAIAARFDIRNDDKMRTMAASLAAQQSAVKAAKYGVSEEETPKTAGTYLDRGILLASRGEYAMAVDDFAEALALNPDIAAAYALRSRAQLALIADEVISVAHNFGGINVFVAPELSDEQAAGCDKAIEDLTQAIRLDPQNGAHYRERGRVHMFKDEPGKAMDDYNKAIRMDPSDFIAYNYRGNAYREKGELDKAYADFNHAIRENPDDPDAYRARGSMYRQKGELDKAIADFDKVLELNPKDLNAHGNRGSAHFSKGNFDKAAEDYQALLEIDPENVMAKELLGTVRRRQGQ
ncbi:MAG: tetratricopeptide repeat protein [Chitinispirillia bacterium]|nr:tetratricopeptide repeat protein [Chitinispirillia bacterium]MCL2242439.1 tetratricopeptide repeat protein [Chitinispirillia bacterium]